MAEYNFFAIYRFPGASVQDRWRLEADSFLQACEMAQELNLQEIEQDGRDEPYYYNEFVTVHSG